MLIAAQRAPREDLVVPFLDGFRKMHPGGEGERRFVAKGVGHGEVRGKRLVLRVVPLRLVISEAHCPPSFEIHYLGIHIHAVEGTAKETRVLPFLKRPQRKLRRIHRDQFSSPRLHLVVGHLFRNLSHFMEKMAQWW